MKDAFSRGRVANIHFWEAVGSLERNKATNRTVLGRLAGLEQHRGKLMKCSWDTQPGEDWAAGKCSRAKSGRAPPVIHSLVPASHACMGTPCFPIGTLRRVGCLLATPTAAQIETTYHSGSSRWWLLGLCTPVSSCSDEPRCEVGLDSSRTDWRGRFFCRGRFVGMGVSCVSDRTPRLRAVKVELESCTYIRSSPCTRPCASSERSRRHERQWETSGPLELLNAETLAWS